MLGFQLPAIYSTIPHLYTWSVLLLKPTRSVFTTSSAPELTLLFRSVCRLSLHLKSSSPPSASLRTSPWLSPHNLLGSRSDLLVSLESVQTVSMGKTLSCRSTFTLSSTLTATHSRSTPQCLSVSVSLLRLPS